MLEFNPINPLDAKTPWLISHRDHRKLLEVDGRIAFLGGINVCSFSSSGSIVRRTAKVLPSTVAWRDTDLRIEGPVERMHAMFAADQQASVAIDRDSWARRPLSLRIKEWMAQLWGRLL